MNERIKQLVLKAYNNAGQGTPDELSLFMQVYSEKFAELIVQECMEQVWYAREDMINENISQVIKDRIKQHFGVE